MDDSTLRRAMLFDFYGELLTEKQRLYYDLHYNEDLSLGEIAEQAGITRQGVWDIIRRADQTLNFTEEKTGLIGRFERLRSEVSELEVCAEKILDKADGDCAKLAAEIINKLQNLKS